MWWWWWWSGTSHLYAHVLTHARTWKFLTRTNPCIHPQIRKHTHTNTHARALEQVASQERVLAKHHGSQIPIVSPKCARDIDFSGPRSEPGNEQPHHIFIPTLPHENEGKGEILHWLLGLSSRSTSTSVVWRLWQGREHVKRVPRQVKVDTEAISGQSRFKIKLTTDTGRVCADKLNYARSPFFIWMFLRERD